jgi:hypothetical protein
VSIPGATNSKGVRVWRGGRVVKCAVCKRNIEERRISVEKKGHPVAVVGRMYFRVKRATSGELYIHNAKVVKKAASHYYFQKPGCFIVNEHGFSRFWEETKQEAALTWLIATMQHIGERNGTCIDKSTSAAHWKDVQQLVKCVNA